MMMTKHKVMQEPQPRMYGRNMMRVTLICACGRSFGAEAQWKIGKESREAVIKRARQRAETVFREHIPIR